MQKLNIHESRVAKVRGLRRKCRTMVGRIAALGSDFPLEDRKDCGCWHADLPVAQSFIDSARTPRTVRRLCIQALLDAAQHLRQAPRVSAPSRVVAAITLPTLFSSQLIVFFGDAYFDSFFLRTTPEQTWVPLPPDRSLVAEWNLSLPEGFLVRGYCETIRDVDFECRGEIWFVGELAATPDDAPRLPPVGTAPRG
jgi:hypothetical protein